MLEDLRNASKKTIGMKQTIKAIQSGNVVKVFLARDIDAFVERKMKEQCEKHGLSITFVDSMKELGEACGIDVSAATVAILE